MPKHTSSRSSCLTQGVSLPQTKAAHAKDVETMDAIIETMYAVISGPAGQDRDWDRFRYLFLPDARLILAVVRKGETPRARVLDIDGYVRRVDPIFESEGFWEEEKERNTETFGSIAHVFSTYESRKEKEGAPFHRGVNSIQLFHDGRRWWIVTVMWNTERE
jgi:hypothetical protein